MVDGSDNNDEDIGVRRQGFFSLIPQPIESVKEFTIITLLAPAQFGRNLGAQVNVLSKSGGKDFHGSLYAFFNSSRLNARNPFDFIYENEVLPLQARRRNGSVADVRIRRTQSGESVPILVERQAGDKDSLTFLQGGGTLGGPIVSEKNFFFVSAEGQLLNAAKETHFAVPTVEQRGFLGTGAEGFLSPISFPTTVVGSYVLGLFPFPNDPNGLYGRNTYTRLLDADARGRVISGRYDHIFGSGNRRQFLNARYNYTDDWRDLQQVGGAVFSSIRPFTRTDNFAAFLNGQLTENLSNSLRISWGRTRLRFEENPYTEDYLSSVGREFTNSAESRFLLTGLGLTNLTGPGSTSVLYTLPNSPMPVEQFLGPIGQVNISGFSPLGVDVFNFPQQRVNNTYQFADTLFYTAERHNITFGADVRRTYLESDLSRNSRLLISSTGAFRGNAYSSTRVPACTPELISANALCLPDLISPIDLVASNSASGVFQSIVLPGSDARIDLSYNQLNFFAQDNFRVRPNFSFSYGLRYELNTVPEEADEKIENSFQTSLPAAVGGLNEFIKGRNKIYDLDADNFAPRLGFAYSPNQKTVIRGGYGVYYDQILGAVVSQSRNVFPTFTTINFGGVQGATLNINTPYNFRINGQPIIQDGTLNTLNPLLTQQQLINSVSGFPTPFGATIPEKELDTPYSHQFSAGVEYEIFSDSNTVISIAYVGTAGRNLLRFATPNFGRNNVVTVDSLTFTGLQPNLGGRNCAPGAALCQGRRVANIGSIDQFETTARSRYDALQVELRGRLMPNFQYQAAYTLSNAKDDVSDVFDLAGAPALPQNSDTFAGEYAAANFDVRHRFAYNFIYDLPLLDNQNGFLRYFLGGWQIVGTGKYNTGQPFTVNTIYDVNQDGNATDRLDNRVFIRETNSRRQPLLLTTDNPAEIRSMLAAIGRDGSVPRNSFRAGDALELDLSFNKRFFIREGQNLSLRFDIFNFINRANYGVPVRFLEAPNFGEAVETITPGRRVQIALKYIF
jgi:hypothetical protein